jgi:hypothetical protein
MILMQGNLFNVRPGEPAFNVHTNLCDYFQIGQRIGDDLWLEGQIIGPENEFVFNGRLFSKNGHVGTILDNFPKASAPEGWTRWMSPLRVPG